MKVALDLDNVTVDTAPYLLKRINEKYGTNFTIEDIKEWYTKFKHPGGEINYTKELFNHFDEPGFLSGVPPMKGATEGIDKLVSGGHKPFFLTGRAEKPYGRETEKWRKDYYPDMKVIYAPEGKDKHVDKFDVLLEDSPKEIKNVGLKGGSTITYDRPWNRKVSPLYGRRVVDWPQAINTMNEY